MTSDDSRIMKAIVCHFSEKRKENGNLPAPSSITSEMILLIRLSAPSKSPTSLLTRIGVVFFDTCCAMSTETLAESLACSRSRLNSLFRAEKWQKEQPYHRKYRTFLEKNVHEPRKWTIRSYPEASQLFFYLKGHSEFLTDADKCSDSTPNLTFQKDVFSWTLFEDGLPQASDS